MKKLEERNLELGKIVKIKNNKTNEFETGQIVWIGTNWHGTRVAKIYLEEKDLYVHININYIYKA
mgnify:CR=1 FL=1